MAWLPPGRRDELLNNYPLVPVTSRTIRDPQAYQSRLSKIARDGTVAERREAVEGIIEVAAAIRDYFRNFIAAIGVAILEAQHDEISVARTVEAARSAAENISAEFGYGEASEGRERGETSALARQRVVWKATRGARGHLQHWQGGEKWMALYLGRQNLRRNTVRRATGWTKLSAR